jgi:DNA-dependent RNA polymerase
MSETARKSSARFLKRNRLASAKKRPRQFIATPFGHKMTGDFLKPLADFLAGKYVEQPDRPPRFLRKLVRELDDANFLALAALAPLLDGIFRGWDRDDPHAGLGLKFKVGDDLYRRLYREPKVALLLPWTAPQRVQAGDWLLRQALALDIFGHDADGFPCVSDKWKPCVAQLREYMIAADPAFAPLLKQPPPWSGWWKSYDDGFRTKFVRDWRPETKAAIDVAFLNPTWEHARGVNALSKVPLKIDTVMLALVERFAVDIMGNDGPMRDADQVTVAADVADAKWCGDRAVWNDYNCDRRGRIYAFQHLNFARADHVRSLFRFANGMKIEGDTYWLEIHCANCEGSTDKEPRDKRIKWVGERRQDIKDIARDPVGTFDKGVLDGRGWKSADSPFAFVAACRELVAAWNDPENFETHLPIGFDGSANGLQHLALLISDLAAAAMVNLLPGDNGPSDVYALLTARAIELIEADDCNHARWWREQFGLLTPKQKRKLLKQPIMTFAYSVTATGATRQIAGVYGSFRQNARPASGAFGYLARKVLQACELELRGPKIVMDYICAVAAHCANQGRFLEWTSPSGFPVSNRYNVPNIKTVACMRGRIRMAEHDIADGVTDQIDHKKVVAAAAPNLVHSLDAAHLIKVINAAVSEEITDLLTVHDCFYCLAPRANRLHTIILGELANLYGNNDPLTALRGRNVGAPDILPVPPKGVCFAWRGGTKWSAQIPISLERVREAKDAFG